MYEVWSVLLSVYPCLLFSLDWSEMIFGCNSSAECNMYLDAKEVQRNGNIYLASRHSYSLGPFPSLQ